MKYIKIITALGFFLMAISVFYYLVIFLPQVEREKLNQRKQIEAEKLSRERQKELSLKLKSQKESAIRTKCYSWAQEQAVKTFKDSASMFPDIPDLQVLAQKDYYNQDVCDSYYRDCLKNFGIEK